MRVVEVGQYFVTKKTGNLTPISLSGLSRIHFTSRWSSFTTKRMDSRKFENWTCNWKSRPVFSQHFKYGIEIRIWSVNQNKSQSCVIISYGTVKYVIDSFQDNTEILAHPQEEQVPQTSTSVVAARSKAQAKPQPRELVGTTATIPIHERRWIDIEPSKTKSCLVWSFEESGQSSSAQSNFTEGRRWSNWILQDKIPSSRPSSSNTKLVRWSMDSLFGCGRRIQTKISVLLWLFGMNYLSPSSSRTFWKQSYWSYSTGQCGNWNWNIPLQLPRWMHIQPSFYYQQWIDNWRSKFEQKTNSVLLVCWSKRWKSQRPRIYWLICTTSRAIHAQRMEKASRRGIFGLILILRSKRDWHSIKHDRMQLFFKEHF